MYDPNEVLRLVDDNVALVLAFGGLSFGALGVYYYEMATLGFRHRVAPLTLVAVTTFFPHDANFVLNFEDWFSTYDHWLLKGFWAALVVTSLLELVFVAAIVRHGREEMAPGLSQRGFELYCAGAMVAGICLWAVLKVNIDDPLYLTTFMLTITWCLPSMTVLHLRRDERRGFSTRQLVAYLLMALGYVLLTVVVFEFRDVWWLVVCALTLVWGAGLAWSVSRSPAFDPDRPGTTR